MPLSAQRHPAYYNMATHTAQPYLAYHNTIDTHAHHNHLPTHSTKLTIWTTYLATDTNEHKHHINHIQTLHHPSLKQPPCHQTQNIHTITNTQQTNPNQPYKQHTHNPPTQTLRLSNNVTKNICYQPQKTGSNDPTYPHQPQHPYPNEPYLPTLPEIQI
jgi:hypothetical protein